MAPRAATPHDSSGPPAPAAMRNARTFATEKALPLKDTVPCGQSAVTPARLKEVSSSVNPLRADITTTSSTMMARKMAR